MRLCCVAFLCMNSASLLSIASPVSLNMLRQCSNAMLLKFRAMLRSARSRPLARSGCAGTLPAERQRLRIPVPKNEKSAESNKKSLFHGMIQIQKTESVQFLWSCLACCHFRTGFRRQICAWTPLLWTRQSPAVVGKSLLICWSAWVARTLKTAVQKGLGSKETATNTAHRKVLSWNMFATSSKELEYARGYLKPQTDRNKHFSIMWLSVTTFVEASKIC